MCAHGDVLVLTGARTWIDSAQYATLAPDSAQLRALEWATTEGNSRVLFVTGTKLIITDAVKRLNNQLLA